MPDSDTRALLGWYLSGTVPCFYLLDSQVLTLGLTFSPQVSIVATHPTPTVPVPLAAGIRSSLGGSRQQGNCEWLGSYTATQAPTHLRKSSMWTTAGAIFSTTSAMKLNLYRGLVSWWRPALAARTKSVGETCCP